MAGPPLTETAARASTPAPSPLLPPLLILPTPLPVADLAAVIGQIGRAGPDITELSLAPEELGRLRLQLIPEGDRIQVILSAERPETLDLLRRNIDQLAEDLRQMGFSSSAFGFAGWSGGQDRGDEARRFSATGSDTAPPPVTQITAPSSPRPGSTAGLDLRL
jgi:hypothetical protein